MRSEKLLKNKIKTVRTTNAQLVINSVSSIAISWSCYYHGLNKSSLLADIADESGSCSPIISQRQTLRSMRDKISLSCADHHLLRSYSIDFFYTSSCWCNEIVETKVWEFIYEWILRVTLYEPPIGQILSSWYPIPFVIVRVDHFYNWRIWKFFNSYNTWISRYSIPSNK